MVRTSNPYNITWKNHKLWKLFDDSSWL